VKLRLLGVRVANSHKYKTIETVLKVISTQNMLCSGAVVDDKALPASSLKHKVINQQHGDHLRLIDCDLAHI